MSKIEITTDEAKLILCNLKISQMALKNSFHGLKDNKDVKDFANVLEQNISFSEILEEKIKALKEKENEQNNINR